MKSIAFLGVILGLAALAAPVQASLVIDDFSSGTADLAVSSGWPTDSSVESIPGVLGGTRTTDLVYDAGTRSVFAYVEADTFNISQDARTRGTCTLTYDPANVDLTASGSGFSIVFETADVASVINVYVYSGANSSKVTGVLTPSGIDGVSTPVDVAFSSFVTDTGSGADFTNVDKIVFEIVGANNGDYAISGIYVPEPMTLALLAAGGAAAVLRRRSAR